MKRALAGVVVVMAVVAVAAGVGVAAQGSDPDVQKLVQGYEAAYNKGDAKAVAAFYTPDALRIGPDGQLRAGRAAIEKAYTTAMGSSTGAKLTIRQGRTQKVTADVLLAEGTYEVTGGSTPVRGKYLNTLVRQGGQLLLASVVTLPEAAGAK